MGVFEFQLPSQNWLDPACEAQNAAFCTIAASLRSGVITPDLVMTSASVRHYLH